jgi:hypothetical protein
MEKGAMIQGMKTASASWEEQGTRFSFKVSRKNTAVSTL